METGSSDNPLISVVMPVYNAGTYLAAALDSILAQTCGGFELIVVDDGSSDGSQQILRCYARLDTRFRLVVRPRKGIVSALNEGIALAKGEFLARMDADDISLPRRFERQVSWLREHPECVAVGCRVLLIDPDGEPICEGNRETSHDEIDSAHMARRGGAICHPSVMMRRDAVLAVGGYRQKCEWAEDYDLFLRLAEKGRLSNLPETLLKYRQHLRMTSHAHHADMLHAVTLALTDACHRRGERITMDHLALRVKENPSPADQHLEWARSALFAGNVATARKHALCAVRRAPFSPRPLRALLRTLCPATPAGVSRARPGSSAPCR